MDNETPIQRPATSGYCDDCGLWELLNTIWNQSHTQFWRLCGRCSNKVGS